MDKIVDLKVISQLLSEIFIYQCGSCQKQFSFSLNDLHGQEHRDGWTIDGEKYWLYVVCPYCGRRSFLQSLETVLV